MRFRSMLVVASVGFVEGVFSAKFKLPDVYGVYQFRVDYNRMGFTHLFSTTQVKKVIVQQQQQHSFLCKHKTCIFVYNFMPCLVL